MDIGIGLPNTIPGTEGRTLIDWARRAEERGFSALATIDRIVYPNYDSLIALAAAAAVTERIRLLTNVLLGPTRNPVLLAKEAASVDQISSGRFILGVAVGARPDDFEFQVEVCVRVARGQHHEHARSHGERGAEVDGPQPFTEERKRSHGPQERRRGEVRRLACRAEEA